MNWANAARGITGLFQGGAAASGGIGIANALTKEINEVQGEVATAAQFIVKVLNRSFATIIQQGTYAFKKLHGASDQEAGNAANSMARHYMKAIAKIEKEFKDKLSRGLDVGVGGDSAETKKSAGVMKEILTVAKELVPTLANLASKAAFFFAIFDKIVSFEKGTRDMRIALGGAGDELEHFRHKIEDIRNSTHLSEEGVFRLTTAFIDAGVAVRRVGTDMDKFLMLGGDLVNLFGVSEEVAANFVRTEAMLNNSKFGKMKGDVDKLASVMGELNLSTHDFNQAMTESIGIWNNYSHLVAGTTTEFTAGLMKMQALYKAMGKSPHEATGDFSRSMGGGDPTTTRNRAQFVANMMGIPLEQAYMTQLRDPASFSKMAMKASAIDKFRRLGKFGGMMGMTPEQANAQFSQKDQMMFSHNSMVIGGEQGRHGLLKNETQLPIGLLANFVQKSGGVLTESIIHKFFDTMTDRQLKEGAGFGVAKIREGMQDTVTATIEDLTRQIEGFVGSIAGIVVKVLPPMLEGIHAISDFVSDISQMVRNVPSAIGALLRGKPDEALGAITHGIKPHARPTNRVLNKAVESITKYLEKEGILEPEQAAGVMNSTKNVTEAIMPRVNLSNTKGGIKDNIKDLTAIVNKVIPITAAPSHPANQVGGNAGWLSSKFEGGVGSVAHGFRTKYKPGYIPVRKGIWQAPHTAAYGAWQMDSGMGTPQKFVEHLQKTNPEMYAQLAPHLGSVGEKYGGFANAWRGLASSNPKGFLEAQKNYLMPNYMGPMLKQFPGLKGNQALQEVAFSAAIQHGNSADPRYKKNSAVGMFERAGFGNVPDEQFVHNLYAERSKQMSGGRYKDEEKLALAALMQQQVQLLQRIADHGDKSLAQKEKLHQESRRQGMVDNNGMTHTRKLASGQH